MQCILGDFGFISEIFKKCVNLMPENAKYHNNFEELIKNNKIFEDKYKTLVNELKKEQSRQPSFWGQYCKVEETVNGKLLPQQK